MWTCEVEVVPADPCGNAYAWRVLNSAMWHYGGSRIHPSLPRELCPVCGAYYGNRPSLTRVPTQESEDPE